ncbi:MAG: siderophore-interacting protein [Silicimonas sp.]|nr:siderophore-interacting protein [Silicimonas sp.]
MSDMTLTHTAQADVADLSYPTMRQIMRHQAAQFELPLAEDGAARVAMRTMIGLLALEPLDREGVRLLVHAETARDLSILRENFISQIAAMFPDVARGVRWSDAPAAGVRPSEFQFAEVLEVRDLCADFLRVSLQLAQWETFDDGSIHFRFALPAPDNTDPDWPVMMPNGASKWPEGEKALHRPVYTIRALDRSTGRVDVDIFRHEGGRTMTWAESVAPGTRVALTGPNSSGVPTARHLLMLGDETAFPAMARIAETLPPEARIEMTCLTHSGQQDYPMAPRPGTIPHWIAPEEAEEAGRSMIARHLERPGSMLWIAAERDLTRRLRAHAAEKGYVKSDHYLAAFWTRSETAG